MGRALCGGVLLASFWPLASKHPARRSWRVAIIVGLGVAGLVVGLVADLPSG